MRTLLAEFRSALLATLVLAVVCCGLYPLVVFGIGQLAFRQKANGSLIVDQHGAVRGSRLLGQAFADEKYFHARPSAAGTGYDAANSGGSNLGPTSQALRDTIKERIVAYRKKNGLQETEAVPADAVTASGSGLDPHIAPETPGCKSHAWPPHARCRGKMSPCWSNAPSNRLSAGSSANRG